MMLLLYLCFLLFILLLICFLNMHTPGYCYRCKDEVDMPPGDLFHIFLRFFLSWMILLTSCHFTLFLCATFPTPSFLAYICFCQPLFQRSPDQTRFVHLCYMTTPSHAFLFWFAVYGFIFSFCVYAVLIIFHPCFLLLGFYKNLISNSMTSVFLLCFYH